VWNVVADGFGNNDPGSGREKGRRSMWDTIHPGRRWATALPNNELSVDEIWEKINHALAGDTTAFLSSEDQLAEAQSDDD
ncbi:MAG: Eco29kI family restriction endonuclease, partial [Herpetosiphonaceae bacterium]|nr:Eco29kI family restriction endonuclease [Herpetosiphonaceae bacterium]